MSLILDALKKLERDRDAREPNVLVVGSVPWGSRTRTWRPLAAGLLGTGLVALLAFALWPRDRAARPPAPPSAPVSSPSPAPHPGPSSAPAPSKAGPAAAAPPEPRRLSPPPTALAPDDARAMAAEPSRPAAQGTDELRLTAISQRDGRPVALINDRLVFEGDGFDGVRVLRIGEAEVEVEVRGQRRVLRF